MTKYTVVPKLVKVLRVVYSKQCWNGSFDRNVLPHKRLIIGKYFVAEHSKTPGLMKGDSFVIEEINQD
jgi:hypothetical protein